MSHSIRDDVGGVREMLRSRGDLAIEEPDPNAWAEPRQEIAAILAHPLSADDAVRIALLNNRDLRAALLELGIARGEMVQAGLLPNPTVHAEVRISEIQSEPLQGDIGFAIDLTGMILAPLRQDAARARLEAARYQTAGAVLDLAYRVRLAFVRYQASAQSLELMRTALASFEASVEAARALFAAGNVRELDLALEEAAYEEARIAVARAELAQADDRERVNALLGLYGRHVEWEAVSRLPDPPAQPLELEGVERRAVEASLDLAWVRAELEATARSIGVARAEGVVPDIAIGVHAEHDGQRWEVGPELTLGLPVFSQNQGTVLAREARLDALRERYLGVAVRVRASARAARNRAMATERIVRRIRQVLLPARERAFEHTLRQYNAMQVDVFRLLEARREQIEAGQQYVDALREHWQARATLEQVIAGRMAGTIDGENEVGGPSRARQDSPDNDH